MLKLRQELVALVESKPVAEHVPQADIDAVADRILRMAQLLRKMREIADRN